MKIMKGSLMVLVLAACAISASATEIKKAMLESAADASVIIVPDGCTQTVKRPFLWDTTETVNCTAILIKDAVGKNEWGRSVSLGNILIYPASVEIQDAQENLKLLAMALKVAPTPSGTKVAISPVTYADKEMSVSEFTKDTSDTLKVKVGGVTIAYSVETKINDSTTHKHSGQASMGIGQN